MTTLDYYKTLNISRQADSTQIKQAYKKLAIRFHPDRNPDDESAADKMARLNEAYAVLSNPEKRAHYDQLCKQFGDGATGQFRQNNNYNDILQESDIEKIFQEIADNFGIRGFNEIFKSGSTHGGGFFMFGTFGHNRGNHPRGSGRNILQGVGKTLLKNVFSQALKAPDLDKSLNCYDTIALSQSHAEKGGPYAYYHKAQDRKLIVKVPENIQEGRKIRLKGLGKEDPVSGEKGDLYLTVSINNNLISKVKKFLFR
ncbi:curved DNA-binding protein [Desulfocicer vacuolatum DSM 3385]|uniref:Curved DNA-binding protein n=1 Tax=Desulfocicer vacuolatum DSM 3385 TaxID=1121400 RepID=A0A1W2C8G1_9BACT|nr:DnaJ domain-containing protein [Desulfocicer vacuolatum]SMC80958.1 curved DNA-binding protein [Desulfocicer vacuolatum DSM 3385]